MISFLVGAFSVFAGMMFGVEGPNRYWLALIIMLVYVLGIWVGLKMFG